MKSVKVKKINQIFLVILSIITLFFFIFVFFNKNDDFQKPNIKNINDEQIKFISVEDLYSEEDTNKNIKSTFTPIEVVWTGRVHWRLTYGRILFENLDPNAEYEYFIAEPNDVISDGGLRYSPTTININKTDTVKVTATIENEKDYCSDVGVDGIEYQGFVPWVFIDKIEVVK